MTRGLITIGNDNFKTVKAINKPTKKAALSSLARSASISQIKDIIKNS